MAAASSLVDPRGKAQSLLLWKLADGQRWLYYKNGPARKAKAGCGLGLPPHLRQGLDARQL